MCNIIVFNFDTLAQIIFIVKSFMIYNTYNAVSSYIHIAESMVWHANPENRNASLRSCFAAPYILREKKSYSLLWSFCLSNVLSYQECTGGMPGRIDSCKLCCADYFNFSLTTQSTNILYIYIYECLNTMVCQWCDLNVETCIWHQTAMTPQSTQYNVMGCIYVYIYIH